MTTVGVFCQVLKLLDDILREGGTSKSNILKVMCRKTFLLAFACLLLGDAAVCKQALMSQVCAYLRSIDEGADGYNEAWDAWADKQNLPVRLEMLNCAVECLLSLCCAVQHAMSLCMMHNMSHACCVHYR